MKRQEANDFRLRAFADASMIAFMCECADDRCRRSVRLSPASFMARRARGELILYEGHVALADAPMAAEDAALEATDTLRNQRSGGPQP